MIRTIAVLADVHANLVALEAVLADIKTAKTVDEYWFLGDVVGYGPQPRQCLQRLSDLVSDNQPWLAGNHDLGMLHCLSNGVSCKADNIPDELRNLIGNMGAADALQIHAWELAGYEEEGWYKRMAFAPTWSIPLPGVAVAHGTVIEGPESAVNVTGAPSYLREPAQASSAFKNIIRQLGNDEARLLVVGHTHIPTSMQTVDGDLDGAWSETRSPKSGGFLDRSEVDVEVVAEQWAVLCPGSIGQSRDKDPRAAYALLTIDSDSNQYRVSFRRIPYDIAYVQDLMLDNGYPEFLINRLALGI